tara:strand:+ start:549 stop:872 length:324 start_codon:yes stop_codon:yes gene_type:complete
MNGNTIEIQEIRVIQAQKKALIKRYKRKMRKHIFIFAIIVTVLSLFLLEFSYALFGDSIKFLFVFFTIFIVVILIYKMITVYRIKQRTREIKKLRAKLYYLMKLEDG